MNLPLYRLLWLLLLSAMLPATASAQWWWPFSKDRNELPAAQQTELARPHYDQAIILRQEGKARAAAREFRKVWNDYSGSAFAADALYQFGEINYERKRWKQAFNAFSRLLSVYPDYPKFDQVTLFIFNIALANAEGDNVRWAYVIPFRAWERAVGYFESLLIYAPYSDLAPLALMNIAQIHQYLGNIPEAIDALDRMINLYPASVLADDAYLELGHTFADLSDGPYYDQGATREAMSYFEDFLVLFPRHPEIGEGEEGYTTMLNQYAESKLVLGKYYYIHRNWFRASEIFFNEAITLAPNSPAAAEARQYLAQLEIFKAAAEADPNYVPPATTWLDRMLFWRSRVTDLTPEAAAEASAEADEGQSAASGPAAGSIAE